MKGFHSFLSVSSQKWYLDIKRERDVYVCIFKGEKKKALLHGFSEAA